MNDCYIQIHSKIAHTDLRTKKVFLRADLNVPLEHGVIHDDFRLQAIVPTIKLIQKQGGTVILATHLGRPKGNYDPALSTQHLIPWFEQQGFTTFFAPGLQAMTRIPEHNSFIVLLENLRFFPGEEQRDAVFAHTLRSLADYYVNDAFGLMHRTDTSITLLPRLFSPSERSVGLLVEQEIIHLAHVCTGEHPRILILGGGKVTTKLPLLEHLLDCMDTVVLCPAVVFTFLKALNKEVGLSRVDEALLDLARTILHKAQTHKKVLLFPQDYLLAHKTLKPPFSYSDHLDKHAIGIALGPRSIASCKQILHTAKTIFFNGPMGFTEFPETMSSTYELLHAIADTDAYSVIGGGDTRAAAKAAGVLEHIRYSSTGGGATLAFLSGQHLSALDIFCP